MSVCRTSDMICRSDTELCHILQVSYIELYCERVRDLRHDIMSF